MQNGGDFSDVQNVNGFMTTRWGIISRATDASIESQAAIEDLCQAYWFPVYTYVRKQGFNATDAEDVTQDFFAEMMRSSFLRRADPDRGRFRSYLLTAVRRLFNRRARSAAHKRGGGMEIISIDKAAAEKRFQETNDSWPRSSAGIRTRLGADRAPTDARPPDRRANREGTMDRIRAV